MKSANPYLFIDGCKEAVAYYQEALGGDVQNIQLADDIEMFKGHEGKYLHAELHLGNSIIHFSDVFGKVEKGDHVGITLECENEDEIRRVYDALKSGGHAALELQKTFWGALHANVTDKYGVRWLLNYQMQALADGLNHDIKPGANMPGFTFI